MSATTQAGTAEAARGRAAIDIEALSVLHAMGCALRGRPAGPLAQGASWERVHALACGSSVEGLVWCAVKDASDMADPLRARWRQEADVTAYRRLQFDVERDRVAGALRQAGVSCLPLKGAAMVSLYACPEMRSMADNDLLVGRVEPAGAGAGFRLAGSTAADRAAGLAAAMLDVREAMEGLGYKIESFGAGSHDVYLKEPMFNFEMHREVFREGLAGAAHFADPWALARAVPGDAHAFRLRPEDEYLLHVAHTHKHFDNSGCGVRCIADERVLLDAYGSVMDWDYVSAALEKEGLAGFETLLRDLADAVCGPVGLEGAEKLGSALPAGQAAAVAFMLGAGTYGSTAARVGRAVERIEAEGASPAAARARYILGRLFQDPAELRAWSPFFDRHPRLIPLAPAYRVGRAVLFRRGRLAAELRALFGR